jgi:hypothetical protein
VGALEQRFCRVFSRLGGHGDNNIHISVVKSPDESSKELP